MCALADLRTGRRLPPRASRSIGTLVTLLVALAIGRSPAGRVFAGAAAVPAPRVIATPHTARRPEPVIADPRHHRVFVGNESAGRVTVLDDSTNRPIMVLRVGHEVEDLALDPITGWVYVANGNSGTVSLITTADRLTVATTIPVGRGPSGLAIDSRRRRVYVANRLDNSVSIIDMHGNHVVRTLAVPGRPQGIGVDTALNRVFVGLSARDRVLAIDGSSLGVIGRIPVGHMPLHPLRVDSGSHRVYVVNAGSSTLSVIDGRSLRVVQTIATDAHPEGLDILPGARRAYVSNEGDPGTDKNSGRSVSIVDLAAGRVLDTVRTGLGPDGVAYDAAVHCLYISVETPWEISVISLPPRDR